MDQVRGGTQPGNRWRRQRAGRKPPPQAGRNPAPQAGRRGSPLAGLGEPVPLAAVTALALLASFPPLGWWPVAWAALAPLTAALARAGTPFRPEPGVRRWLGAGFAFGIVYWAGQFSWLGYTFVDQGGVPPWAALCFYVAFVVLLACVPALAFGVVAGARRAGLAPTLTLPLAFGAMDLLLGRWPFDGLGWGSLAAPQAHTLAAGLIAPLLGAPGLVAALGFVNSAWAGVLARPAGGRSGLLASRPKSRFGRVSAAVPGTLLLGILTLALLLPWSGEVWTTAGAAGEMRALLVPGQLTLRELWAGEGTPAAFRTYLLRTFAALEPRMPYRLPDDRPLTQAPVPQAPAGQPPIAQAPAAQATVAQATEQRRPLLVVWPESAAMQPLTRGQLLVDLTRVGTLLDADFLLGADAEDPGRVTNALYLVTGGRFDFARYDKLRLVPFGEYVPAGFRWVFGRKLTAGDADYVPGRLPPVLDWRGLPLGLAICFESILPQHARQAVRAGAEVLVVAANEAWLPGYAQAQHVQLTALRAREVGRDALFVSNGGPTALLRGGSVFVRASAAEPALEVRARLSRTLTPWARWGAWGFVALAAAVLMAALAAARRRTGRS